MSWTDERVETLKKMWAEGQSASQIAKELGGVTRNAVIGKVHRLGLSNRVGGPVTPEVVKTTGAGGAAAPAAASAAPRQDANPRADLGDAPRAASPLGGAAASARPPAEPAANAAPRAPERLAERLGERLDRSPERGTFGGDRAAADRLSERAGSSGSAEARPAAGGGSTAGTMGAASGAASGGATVTPLRKAVIPASQPLPPQPSVGEISAEAIASMREVEKRARRLTLMELTERTCKWPIGDPATDDFWFCGLPSLPGKPYCEAHVGVAFQPMSARRDRRR